MHTSRDIRAVASQLVKLWVETFRKEKAAGVLTKPLHQSSGFKAARKMAKMKAGLKLETEARDRTLTPAGSSVAPGHPIVEKENFQLGSNAPDSADTEKKDSVSVFHPWKIDVFFPKLKIQLEYYNPLFEGTYKNI